MFVKRAGSYNGRRTLTTLIRQKRLGRDVTELNLKLQQSDAEPFLRHVLLTLSNRGNTATRQLYFNCQALLARGMSMNGIEMLSSWGIGLSKTAYNEQRGHELELETQRTR